MSHLGIGEGRLGPSITSCIDAADDARDSSALFSPQSPLQCLHCDSQPLPYDVASHAQSPFPLSFWFLLPSSSLLLPRLPISPLLLSRFSFSSLVSLILRAWRPR